MTTLNRRRFVQLGGLGATGLGLSVPVSASWTSSRPPSVAPTSARQVEWRRSRTQSGGVLARAHATGRRDVASVRFVFARWHRRAAGDAIRARAGQGAGGVLADWHTRQSLAVRALAEGPSRVIVQDESHLYQDEGDCAQTLSGLTLIPLALRPGDVHRRRSSAGHRPDPGRKGRASRLGHLHRDTRAPEAG